nr:hypothetical protein [Tanacetum cinerariifolium]
MDNRISAPSHRMPTNLKIYDGSTDPDDHITRFVEVANQGEWEMPVWCRMFQHTLDEPARGWFDRLPNGCIDSWTSLWENFSERLKRWGTFRACRRVDDFVKSKEAYKSTEFPKGEHLERSLGAPVRCGRPPRVGHGSGQQRTDNYGRRDHYQPYAPHRAFD